MGSGQGGGDLLGRGALRFGDQPSAVVAVVEGLAGGVPGVGGGDGAGLAHIAAVAVQGRGGQQVDLVPGAALDPVDGERNAKLVLGVVLERDALGMDLYRRKRPPWRGLGGAG